MNIEIFILQNSKRPKENESIFGQSLDIIAYVIPGTIINEIKNGQAQTIHGIEKTSKFIKKYNKLEKMLPK